MTPVEIAEVDRIEQLREQALSAARRRVALSATSVGRSILLAEGLPVEDVGPRASPAVAKSLGWPSASAGDLGDEPTDRRGILSRSASGQRLLAIEDAADLGADDYDLHLEDGELSLANPAPKGKTAKARKSIRKAVA